jgi:hypothetical protein
MRGKAWKSTAYLLGVAQPRLKGTTFRLVLTLRTSVGRPRMANPAVSLQRRPRCHYFSSFLLVLGVHPSREKVAIAPLHI